MSLRERGISELVRRLAEKSRGFTNPHLILIGGYALRAYVPYARYSRDCDFALPKSKTWNIDKIVRWVQLTVETKEKFHTHGYLRLIGVVSAGRLKIKLALDFMEGEVRGRRGDTFRVDERFVSESLEFGIRIGESERAVRVPAYHDYFLLKLMAGRPSDVRDIVAMIWSRGLPDLKALAGRISAVVSPVALLGENLDRAIADVADHRFLDSWRGTFVTPEFTAQDKAAVTRKLRVLQRTVEEL